MPASFDPYYTWLAIPPEEQPPHLYRLLGLKPLEENLDVIENAADQKMMHLRTYQSGKNADASQKLLNEISTAKVTLLDPAKKSAYDGDLRAKLNLLKQAELKKARQERPLSVAQPLPVAAPLEAQPLPLAAAPLASPSFAVTKPATIARRGSNSLVTLVAGGGVALLLLVVGVVGAWSMLRGDSEVATNDRPASGDDEPSTNDNNDGATPIVPPVIPPATGGGESSNASPAADLPLEIISAVYGVNQNWFDVTEELQSLVQDQATWSKIVSNDDFGDPAPDYHMGNTLLVHYAAGARTGFGVAYEGRQIRLSSSGLTEARAATSTPPERLDPHKVHVYSAFYGVNQSFINVTENLSAKADGRPRWSAVIDDQDWGDPAPGYHLGNTLVVRYAVGGEAKLQAIYQGRTIELAAPSDETIASDDPSGEEVALADEPQAAKKLPLPDRATRDAKRKEILAIFPVAQARTFEQKGEYAAQLIRTAGESADDPAAQFTLLNLAREQAAESGQIQLALEATDMLGKIFDFDAAAVRLASVQQAARATLPPAAKRKIVVAGMDVIDALAAAEKYSEADGLSERLQTVVRPLREPDLMKALGDQRRVNADLSANFHSAQAAFAALKTNPDDDDANLTAGSYLAIARHDWTAGLAHWAKASDAALATAAKADLAAPKSLADREKLADAWWAAAEAHSDANVKEVCRRQALHHDRAIVIQLVGLAKAKVERRIAEAGATSAAPALSLSQAAAGQRVVEQVYLDDLAEFDSSVGHGVLGKHGDDYDGQRNLSIGGEIPAHALTMVPKTNGFSHITYHLHGAALALRADAAQWATSTRSQEDASKTPVTFAVVGDGRLLWRSRPIQRHGDYVACYVNIRHVHELQLQVHCPGDLAGAWAVWLNPRITRLVTAADAPLDLGVLSRDPAELSNQLAPSASDAWDISQGVTIAKSSPMLHFNDYHADIRNLFGGEFGQYPPREKSGSLIFGDADRDAVHFVEWKTKSPVTIRRIALFAAADGGGIDQRRASRFTLAAWDGRSKSFRVFYEADLGKPYGATDAPPRTVVESDESQIELRLEAEVPPTTAQLFRAEFVQAENSVNSRAGIRLLELDGFEQPRGTAQPDSAAKSPEVVYLDDVAEVDAKVGFGVLGKHGFQDDGKTKQFFQGKTPAHSLNMHATTNGASFATYRLGGKYETFEAIAGQWDAYGGQDRSAVPLVFTVVGDGKELWRSRGIQMHGDGEACKVNIRGIDLLTLRVDCPGEDGGGWSCWVEPRVSVAADAPRTTPQSAKYVGKTHVWQRGDAPLQLAPVADSFCFLTRLGGSMAGFGEEVRISVGGDGRWHLGGTSQQPLAASATVIASDLRREFEPTPTRYKWDVGQGRIKMLHQREGFCLLAEVAGAFDGDGEQARVYIDPKDGFWYLEAIAKRDISAAALALKLRRGARVKLEFAEHVWKPGDTPVKMISSSDGFAFLSGISGDFAGGGERVSVEIVDGTWQLDGTSQTPLGARAVSVRVR